MVLFHIPHAKVNLPLTVVLFNIVVPDTYNELFTIKELFDFVVPLTFNELRLV